MWLFTAAWNSLKHLISGTLEPVTAIEATEISERITKSMAKFQSHQSSYTLPQYYNLAKVVENIIAFGRWEN